MRKVKQREDQGWGRNSREADLGASWEGVTFEQRSEWNVGVYVLNVFSS